MAFPERLTTMIRRAAAGWKAAGALKPVSGPADVAEGPVAFAVVRNEMLRLPRFLSYYRDLGIRHFVIVENNSTDATREYLAAQHDVRLYATSEHFTGKEAWLNYLFRKHGAGRWCLVADADELIDYPSSDRVSLPDLCRYLEQTGSNALHAILLDLYPQCPVSDAGYVAGSDYFLKSWFFDRFETLTRAPRHFFRGSGLDFRFEGGVRKRLFGISACCSKFPLFRYDAGMFLTDGQHYLEGGQFSGLRAVLYHFKYLQDFEPHVREEAERGEHWGGAVEYKAYADKFTRDGSRLHLWNQDSISLQGTRQLEDDGFLVRPDSYEKFLMNLPEGKP